MLVPNMSDMCVACKCLEAAQCVSLPFQFLHTPQLPFSKERLILCRPTQQVIDASLGRAITVAKENLPDAVVWNPWAEKAAGMADFGNEEYKARFCPWLDLHRRARKDRAGIICILFLDRVKCGGNLGTSVYMEEAALTWHA